MPYATNPDDGTRIYYEVEGAGSPLVMLPGFTSSSQIWHGARWVDPLVADHEIVLIDPRGHGRSDKPHEPDAYAWQKDVADVIAVLDELGIGSAHILGYSMGTAIACWIGWYVPQRARSLIIGGAGPAPPSELLQIVNAGVEWTVHLYEESWGDEVTESARAMFRTNDVKALIARLMSQGMIPDDVLADTTIPALFYGGAEDPLSPARSALPSHAERHPHLARGPGCVEGGQAEAIVERDARARPGGGALCHGTRGSADPEFLARVDSEVAATA